MEDLFCWIVRNPLSLWMVSGTIFWHQITKDTGRDYWVSSIQKYQGSVIKINSKAYLKTLEMGQHLHATENKIRDDYVNGEKAKTSLPDKLHNEK